MALMLPRRAGQDRRGLSAVPSRPWKRPRPQAGSWPTRHDLTWLYRTAGLAAGPHRRLRRRPCRSRPGRPERLGAGRLGPAPAPDPRGTRLAGGAPGRGDPALRGRSPREGHRPAPWVPLRALAGARLGVLTLEAGDTARGTALLRDALDTAAAAGDRPATAAAVEGLAAAALRTTERRAGGGAARRRRLDPRRGRPQQPRRARLSAPPPGSSSARPRSTPPTGAASACPTPRPSASPGPAPARQEVDSRSP